MVKVEVRNSEHEWREGAGETMQDACVAALTKHGAMKGYRGARIERFEGGSTIHVWPSVPAQGGQAVSLGDRFVGRILEGEGA